MELCNFLNGKHGRVRRVALLASSHNKTKLRFKMKSQTYINCRFTGIYKDHKILVNVTFLSRYTRKEQYFVRPEDCYIFIGHHTNNSYRLIPLVEHKLYQVWTQQEVEKTGNNNAEEKKTLEKEEPNGVKKDGMESSRGHVFSTFNLIN